MSTDQDNIRIVEINGVKLEIDLRTARKIDQFRVGDHVRVLDKQYGDAWRVWAGCIVDFIPFKNLPTITVCVMDTGYRAELAFVHINAMTKDVEIAPMDTATLEIDKGEVCAGIQSEIDTKRHEIEQLEEKRTYFLAHFGRYFKAEDNA